MKKNRVFIIIPTGNLDRDLCATYKSTIDQLVNMGYHIGGSNLIYSKLPISNLLLHQKTYMLYSFIEDCDYVYYIDGQYTENDKFIISIAQKLGLKVINTLKCKDEIIFISGPISKEPNFRNNFNNAEEYLRLCGYKNIINPVKVADILPASIGYDKFLDIDLAMLASADTIYMLNNWEKSNGSSTELKYAEEHKKKIMFEEWEPIKI